MTLTARKAAELRHRLDSLDGELGDWRAETATGGRLEKHWSQIEAVATELGVPIAALDARIGRLDGPGALEEATAIENVVADLHRLWDMFRGRLMLRYVDRYAPYLVGADELAYRCYQPAEARGAGREPPLVAFADQVSPVIRPRGQQLRPPDALASGDPLGEVLRRLPVALIDLPWSQIEHLPDAPIIAHEVGHDVEADLGLAEEMESLLEAALEHAGVEGCHRRAWAVWRAEAFADVFGTLCLGPAFTSALIDFLAGAPRSVAVEWQADPYWRPHPPSTLRIHLSTAVLAANGFEADADTLRALWTDAYPSHSMAAFLPDVDVVARTLVAGPYTPLAGGALTALVSFSADSHEQAGHDACELLANRPAESEDARELIAAARLAFDACPAGYDRCDVSRRVLTLIRDRQQVGRRASKPDDRHAAELRSRASGAGHWLMSHLENAYGLEPSGATEDTDVQAQQ